MSNVDRTIAVRRQLRRDLERLARLHPRLTSEEHQRQVRENDCATKETSEACAKNDNVLHKTL